MSSLFSKGRGSGGLAVELAVWAVSDEVIGDDRFNRRRRDVERLEPCGTGADHIVPGQQPQLIKGQQRPGQQAKERCLQPGERQGNVDQRPVDADFLEDVFQQVAERPYVRAAELEGLAGEVGRGINRLGDGGGDIADIDRLEPAVAADDGHDRRDLRQPGKAVEEAIFRPEDQRRPQDDGGGEGGAHMGLAFALGAGVVRRRLCIRADRRDMDQRFDLCGGRSRGDALRALGLHAVERLPTGGEEDADQIDDGAGARHRAGDGRRVAHVGLDDLDLADRTKRLQEQRQLRVAHGDPHAVAGLGQLLHDITPEKARSADYRHQIRHARHLCYCPPLMPKPIAVDNSRATPYRRSLCQIAARRSRFE